MSQWTAKVAVITGAASGIGAGLARYCVGPDMHVVATDVDTAGLEQLEGELKGRGDGSLLSVKLDVTNQGQVEWLASDVFGRFGAVMALQRVPTLARCPHH